MDTNPVIVSRTFNVPAAKVWEALTDNNQLQQWYFVLPEFEAEPGFMFTFTGGPEDGPQYIHHCVVVEAIPESLLSYTWRYEGIPGNSLVSITLLSEGEHTHLTLTHSGLETIEPAGADFKKENFLEGWTYFVHTALADFLED